MQKNLTSWVQAKAALEKLEDSCLDDLRKAETDPEERIEALSSLLSISHEPCPFFIIKMMIVAITNLYFISVVGSNFSFRVVKKDALPLFASVLRANRQKEVLYTVQILRRITTDDGPKSENFSMNQQAAVAEQFPPPPHFQLAYAFK